MIRYKIDSSEAITVGVCRECGARFLTGTRDEARQVRDRHEEIAHMKRGRHTTRRADTAMRTS